jgi:hypothetical protein
MLGAALTAAIALIAVFWSWSLADEPGSGQQPDSTAEASGPNQADSGDDDSLALAKEARADGGTLGLGAAAVTDLEGADAQVDGSKTASIDSVNGVPAVPIALPLEGQPPEYSRGTATESWQFISSSSCADYARVTLLSLRDSGARLVEAGYLDLLGASWGCVAQDDQDRSLSVILLPEDAFAAYGEQNRLKVTVLHYLEPKGLGTQP